MHLHAVKAINMIERHLLVFCLKVNKARPVSTDLWSEQDSGRVTYKSNSSCWCHWCCSCRCRCCWLGWRCRNAIAVGVTAATGAVSAVALALFPGRVHYSSIVFGQTVLMQSVRAFCGCLFKRVCTAGVDAILMAF